ncbi:MAG TPA: alpha/beta hydrolase family protein [Burkholderiales bacterium]|nr:alpha/beta hydrolase family protein [Burkholderiales bacterium]
MKQSQNRRVLIFGIHRTVDWWQYLGQNMGWGESVVVTDLRGEGEICIVDDFYAELGPLRAKESPRSPHLTDAEVEDVIARCRALRWLDSRLARAMAHAVAIAFDRVLERTRPRLVLSLPIDRYVTDVLERLARKRGIRYFELTASPFPDMSMLLERGALVRLPDPPAPEVLEARMQELSSPAFVPSYVRGRTKYNHVKFVRTMGYFQARGLAFRAIGWAKRDPLNLHYLDAQPFLGHKCRWKDIRVLDMCDYQWRDKLSAFPIEKRVFLGMQLFPEASIDYWLQNRALIDHENLIVQAVSVFSKAGYLVLVKDHPLQFGFRHTDVLERLLAMPNVVFVPYDVSGNELLSLVKVNFTCTGTLGLQAALAGLTSIVTESYYANDRDFVLFREPSELSGLPERIEKFPPDGSLEARRRNIIEPLLRGSFEADFFTFRNFDRKRSEEGPRALAGALGHRLDLLAEGGNL